MLVHEAAQAPSQQISGSAQAVPVVQARQPVGPVAQVIGSPAALHRARSTSHWSVQGVHSPAPVQARPEPHATGVSHVRQPRGPATQSWYSLSDAHCRTPVVQTSVHESTQLPSSQNWPAEHSCCGPHIGQPIASATHSR
jgi:hypothetical protein